MKTLQKITLYIAIVALFASCQTGTDVNKILSNQDTKMAIMDTIANDSNLSVEMMETMMNRENSKMMMMRNDKMAMIMMQNQGSMLKMMQNNPAMMQSMMNGMIETCYRDSAIMSSMCSTIINKSCQTGTDVNKILSNQDTKMAIMDTIANDNNLSIEMMEVMMSNENGKMMMMGNEKITTMMMGNQGSMLKIMQKNPAMMQSMMTGMIETCYRDSAMMTSMCSSIMNNPQMMDMLNKNMVGNMGTKGMNNMQGMNRKTK